jgi:hypothetical protein
MSLRQLPSDTSPDDIECIQLTQAEWEYSVQLSLAEAGLTYEELEAQARRGYFEPYSLHALWISIGRS